MSGYLDDDHDTSDDEGQVNTLTEDEIDAIRAQCGDIKAEGNALYSSKDFDGAIEKYTQILNLLKASNLPPDDMILTNRSAAYIALKRYVPGAHDAQLAAKANKDNWKAYSRYAMCLLGMAPRKFRTKQAIQALQTCLECPTLPAEKKKEVETGLMKAKARLEEQDANTPMPDMSNCMPS